MALGIFKENRPFSFKCKLPDTSTAKLELAEVSSPNIENLFSLRTISAF
jgi:hypothetical protein